MWAWATSGDDGHGAVTLTLAALAPLLLVVGLLGSGRFSALIAGLCGLLSTVVVAVFGAAVPMQDLLVQMGEGLWLAWLVISIIVSGMFFHRCVQLHRGSDDPPLAAATPARLWTVCFLVAPFAESVTGFGVGYIVALGALSRLGIAGMPALLLGLFSQSLVPWGALGIGTTVGASLSGLSVNELGLRSAILQGPIHLLYLLIYWRLAASAGWAVSLAQKLDDLAWTLLLIGLLALANAVSEVEIAGALPTALLLAIRFWRDERPSRARLLGVLREQSPYVLLTLVLCATRLISPIRDALKSLWAIRPFESQPAFSPFYAAGFWLLLVSAWVLLSTRAVPGPVLSQTLRGAWRACGVTLAFLVMAQLYVGSGLARQLADALSAVAGAAAAAGVPLFAAVAGFLTGSGAASNAMLMPMVNSLAISLHLDDAWLAAVQNGVCANLSMLSPIRVSMGAAILGFAASEGLIYRKAWHLALPPVVVGLGAVGLLTWLR